MAKTRGTGTIGGTDGQHFPGSGPFRSAAGMKATSKFCHMTGVKANPGGEGNKISANAERGPVKGGINGAGTAK